MMSHLVHSKIFGCTIAYSIHQTGNDMQRSSWQDDCQFKLTCQLLSPTIGFSSYV